MRDGASCFRHKLLSPSCHSTMAKIRTELESNLYLKKIPRKCSINVCPHLHHPYRKFFQESSIVASRYKKIELKVQISRMEVKCASIWNEESEMIAHLQSMFWNSSDADASLSSPNSSTSSCIEPSTLPTALFLPLIQRDSYDKVPLRNTATDWCLDHQSQAFAGDKRALLIDESRKKSTNSNKKARNVSPVLRTLSSNALDDESNAELINHSSSWCCISEDDSIGVYESAVLKQSNSSRGRSRSSKNSQSVYAKKRRERINEKLKTLQQLIPNGTKVDISTMLEEAVQYVKFLQLQIKLLSSDETRMYAPLAYNHMSIDSNLNHSEKQ